MFGQLNDK